MEIIAPRSDSLGIIALRPVKKWIGVNRMSLSTPWEYSIDIIALKPEKNTRDQPNGP